MPLCSPPLCRYDLLDDSLVQALSDAGIGTSTSVYWTGSLATGKFAGSGASCSSWTATNFRANAIVANTPSPVTSTSTTCSSPGIQLLCIAF